MSARAFLASVVSFSLAASPVCATTVKSVPNLGKSVVGTPLSSVPALPTLPVLNVPQVHLPNATLPSLNLQSFQAQPANAASPIKALEAVHQVAVPVQGAQAVEPQQLNRVWDASKPRAENQAPSVQVPQVPAGSSVSLTPSTPKAQRKVTAPGLRIAAGAAAAPVGKGLLGTTFAWAAPYLYGGAVLGVTWVAQRLVRAGVSALAKRGKWNPNTTDTVLFVATLTTWLAGAAIGMKLAGIELAAIFTTFGIAITLAVRSTVSNLVQAVIILVQRPFVVGETVRIGETLYLVEDMQLQHVTMRERGKLVKEAPAADKVEKGFSVKPFQDVDPLGREADEKGNRFVMVRDSVLTPKGELETFDMQTIFPYTALASAAVTLFRPYTRDYKKMERAKLKAALIEAKNPVSKFLKAVNETGRGPLLRAALWMALAIAAIPLLPLLKTWITWHVFLTALPYLHAIAVLVAARYSANFLGRLVPRLFEKFGRSPQAAVVARLLVELLVWAVGLTAAMRNLGVEWGGVVQSLGVTAAAMTVATNDVLKNLAQAITMRLFNRHFEVGDLIRTKAGELGEVVEMGMFYVIIKPAEGVHTVVPYGALDSSELAVYKKKPVEPDETNKPETKD